MAGMSPAVLAQLQRHSAMASIPYPRGGQPAPGQTPGHTNVQTMRPSTGPSAPVQRPARQAALPGATATTGNLPATTTAPTNPNARRPENVVPLNPRARTDRRATGGVAGNSGGGGGGSSQGATGQAPGPTNPTVNTGRMQILESLLATPESMNEQWQQLMFQRFADQRDVQNQDMQRVLRERYGANADANGALARELFDLDLARERDLLGAQRDISTLAATTNFQDRQNVANLALQHQLGIGNLALQNRQLDNAIFNQDRAYETQLANLMMDLGMQGQNQQSNLLGQLNALIGSGLNYRDALAQLIFGQAQGRYADPGVSAVGQFSYAPNPYLEYLAGQGGSGGGNDADWFSMAMQAAQTGAMFL